MVANRSHRSISDWAVIIFGVFLILIGVPIMGGGIWLILLGGSFYYAVAGLGLAASGILLTVRKPEGAWVYASVYVATLAWTLWEVGIAGWAVVPRVVAPTVLALIFFCCLPTLRRWAREHSTVPASTALLAVIATGIVAFALALFVPGGAPIIDRTAAQVSEPSSPTSGAPAMTVQVAASGPLERNTADTWLAYGANNHATRYSPAAQITPANVSRLAEAWHFRTGDLPEEDEPAMPPASGRIRYAFQNTPLKVGDTLYVCTPSQIVIALDPGTGVEKWRFDPKVDRAALANVTTSTCRGVAYFEAPTPVSECQRRIIYGTIDSRLLAIDAATGAPCRSFGENGAVNLNRGIGETLPGYVSMTSPPTIVRGITVVGHQVIDGQYRNAPSGVVRGFDSITGAFAWAWDMGRPGVTTEPPAGQTYTRSTPNVWTITSADEELGLVYLPTGNASGDYYGGDRTKEEEQFSSSLVAVDVTTGTVRWSFQTVHHDIWDYDLGSQATLIDFPTENGSVPALVLPTKQGQLFVLNRATGEPLTQVTQRAVPQSGSVEGEWTSPTQPFSTGMPDLIGPRLTERDTWGVSPLDHLWCRIQFRRLRYDGPYTPPSIEGTIFQPGFNGGVDWGGVAVDPVRNLLIVNNNNLPNVVRLIPRDQKQETEIKAIGDKEAREGGVYAQRGLPYGATSFPWRTALKVPCTAPPWGYIGAIDLRTRKFVWRHPLGTGRDHGPFGIPSMLPIRMGTPNNGGSAVTAGGLTFIAAALDRVIRGFNTETGELMWQARLPAGGQAGPTVYEHNGRQFVVLAAGGHNSMETRIGDSVIAYALADN